MTEKSGRAWDASPASSEAVGMRLRRLISEQRDCCAALAGLIERQERAVRDSDTDALLEILGQRQTLIDRIVRINEDLTPFREHWEDHLKNVAADEREALRAATREASDLIATVRAADERDRLVLEQRRATIAGQLQTVRHSSGAIAAYSSAGNRDRPAFQDREA